MKCPACRRKTALWRKNWIELQKKLPMLTVPSNDLRRYCLLVLVAVNSGSECNDFLKLSLRSSFPCTHVDCGAINLMH